MAKKIRVLVVDDQEVIRQGLRHILELEDDMSVVGDCASAEEVFAQVNKLGPDIILMDGDMPKMDGIEATRELKRNGFSCDAVVVIFADRGDDLIRALEAGASGYLLKDTKRQELADAIRQVYHNERLAGDGEGFVEELELVIPLPVDAVQLMKFVGEVEDALNATVMQSVGSWDWGAVVTVSVKPTSFEGVLSTLSGLPDVERIESDTLTAAGPGFFKKFRALQKSRGKATKSVMLTLRRVEAPREALVPALG